MLSLVREYEELVGESRGNIEVVDCPIKDLNDASKVKTFFSVYDRMYRPVRSETEVGFMKFLLYDKAKFIPFIH